jgi:hypothetical protein
MPGDVAPQSQDILWKRLHPLLGGRSLRSLGIDAPPATAVMPTELPAVSIRMQVLDYLVELADGSCLHLEFQSTSQRHDLVRFLLYDARLYERDRRRIRTVVIYTGGVRQAPRAVDAGCLGYRVENVYLSRLDGHLHLVELKERAATAGLSADDALEIAVLILMRHRGRSAYEVALEATNLAAALPEEVRDDCRSAVLGFAERYLTDHELRGVMEVDAMAGLVSRMIAEGEAKGKAEGKAEGEAKGRAEDVVLVLGERFGEVPAGLAERIRGQHDLATLRRWMVAALRAASLADFEREIRE